MPVKWRPVVSIVLVLVKTELRKAHLSCRLLANKTRSLFVGGASQSQAQAFDVGVRRGAIIATLVFDLADLNHLEGRRSRALVSTIVSGIRGRLRSTAYE